MKKQMIGLLAAVIAISAALVGCGSNNGQSSQSSSAESSVSSTVSRVNEDADKPVGYQLDLCLGSGWFEKPCCSDVEHTTCTCQLYYQP